MKRKDTTQPMEELEKIIDELIEETIEQAYQWYGCEAPHDVKYYDHTLPEAKAKLTKLIAIQETKARIDELAQLQKFLKSAHLYDQDSAMKLRWHFYERLKQLNPNPDRKKVDV